MFALICLSVLMAVTPPAPPKDFWGYWGDGKAELSSYKVRVARYGELRDGYAVLIFVTEDMNRRTRIKVESDEVPPSDRVPVLKLNRVVKFTTGIYDYSLMTSVFSAVESEQGRPPLEPMKISFTAQEWCGMVLQMLVPQEQKAAFTLHSYFQAEGDQQRDIEVPAAAIYEDNLPIWIRELKGEVMAAGERREVRMMPSMWNTRSRHVKPAFEAGWIEKQEGGAVASGAGTLAAWKWHWHVGDRDETYFVEKASPNRILKWESSDGGRGELLVSERLPYWRLHGTQDVHYRDELKIPE